MVARPLHRRAGDRPGRVAARPHGHQRAGARHPQLPAPVLRRHAPARHARHGHVATSPALLIADEPTTALDVTIQAQILELLRELNRDFGTAIVLISHDLGVIASVCARVVVMYAGEVVEEGSTEEVLSDPRHPYTWALINAVPRIDRHTPGNRRLTTIEGAPPDPLDLPQGCRFAPRCPFRIERCTEHPELLEVAPGRNARCWVTQAGEPLPPPRAPLPAAPRAVDAPAAPRRPRRGRAAPRGARPGEALPAAARTASSQKRLIVHAVDGVDLDVAARRDRRPRRRVGLRQIDACPRCVDPHPQAGRGLDRASRARTSRAASAAEIRPLRRRMQMVFQDPYASLNPRMTVADISASRCASTALPRPRPRPREQVAELLVDRRPQPEGGAALPARVLRRPAPAHLDRPGARGRARTSSSPTSRSRRSTSTSRRRSST